MAGIFIEFPKVFLDDSSPMPLYYQLKEHIKEYIEQNGFSPGCQLPSERELAEQFSLSRMTVRQATTSLVYEGVLYRRRGKGTFVSKPKIIKDLQLSSFTEDMHSRGIQPSTRLLSMTVQPVTDSVAKKLGIDFNAKVIRIERLRLANGEPMALELSTLPYDKFPGLEQIDLARESLYKTLENKFQVRVRRGWQSIEASLATARESELLQIPEKAPVLLMERLTEGSEHGEIVEHVKSIYRGDKYKFRLELSLRGG